MQLCFLINSKYSVLKSVNNFVISGLLFIDYQTKLIGAIILRIISLLELNNFTTPHFSPTIFYFYLLSSLPRIKVTNDYKTLLLAYWSCQLFLKHLCFHFLSHKVKRSFSHLQTFINNMCLYFSFCILCFIKDFSKRSPNYL